MLYTYSLACETNSKTIYF